MAVPIHCFNIAILIGLFIIFSVTPFNFDGTGLWIHLASLAGLTASGLLARRYRLSRIATACEALGLMGLNGFLMVWVLGLLCATNLPLVDQLLSKWDAVLGFDLRNFMNYFSSEEALLIWLRRIYASIQWQPILLIIILCIRRREQDCWVFLNSWIISLASAIFIFPFFPAAAPLNYYHISPKVNFHAADFYPVMAAIRAGNIHTIGAVTMKGMVTFPSFHAASAICLAWGFAKLKWLRWPFLLLNLAMLLATIASGAHYLIDLLAGILIAGGAIWFSQRAITRVSHNTPRST